VERYNRTLVRQLRCYVAQHQSEWDSNLSLLTTACNTQVHSSAGEIPFAFLSPRRLQLIGIERMPRLRQAEERPVDASSAAEQYLEDLKVLIPKVREHLGTAQTACKRAFDVRTREKNNQIKAGDWVYLNAHFRSPKKIWFKTQGPYMVLQTDGYRFPVESPRGIRTVSSDHVTEAATPSARDAKWTRALRAQALCKEETQPNDDQDFVFEKFIKHGWSDDGQLKLLVKWFGFPEKEATWQFASCLPREALRKYNLRKKMKLPALTREGVFFSDQVKRRLQDRHAALRGKETKRDKKSG